VGSLDDVDPSEWQVPPHCIPIHANIITFDWSRLYSVTSFDVIMMDPPWQLATANPTRGVALGYSQLTGEAPRMRRCVCVCVCVCVCGREAGRDTHAL
jgi:mRNA (2'-O-methyladenosine-N6-)-methyltransferase